jgi:hypothetical protein
MKAFAQKSALFPTVLAGLFLAASLAGPGSWASTVKKESSFYVLEVKTAIQGQQKVATITVKGKGGFYCNTLYPWKLTLKPAAGATVDKDVYRKADATKFEKAAVVFSVPFAAPGGGKVAAELKLSMCNPKQCQMDKVSFTW